MKTVSERHAGGGWLAVFQRAPCHRAWYWSNRLDFTRIWKVWGRSLFEIKTFLSSDVSNSLFFSPAVGHDFENDEKTTLFNNVQTPSCFFELRDSIILILAPLERSHSKDQLMYTIFFVRPRIVVQSSLENWSSRHSESSPPPPACLSETVFI